MRRFVFALALMMAFATASAQAPAEFQKLMEQHKSYIEKGDLEKAISSAEKARSVLEKSISDTYNGDYFNVMQDLGEDYMNARKFKESVGCYQILADVLYNHAKSDDPGYLTLMYQQYVLCSYIADDADFVISTIERLCERLKDDGLHNCEQYIDMMAYLGDRYAQSDDPRKASGCYKEALSLAESVLGKGHEKAATIRNKQHNLKSAPEDKVYAGNIEEIEAILRQKMQAGNYQEVIQYGEKVMSDIMKNKTEFSDHAILVLNQVGNAYIKLGQYQQAIKYYDEMLAYVEKHSEKSSNYVVAVNNVATIYGLLNNLDNEANLRIKSIEALLEIENLSYSGSSTIGNYASMLETIINHFESVKSFGQEELGVFLNNNIYYLEKTGKGGESIRLQKMLLSKLESTVGTNNRCGFLLLQTLGLHYRSEKKNEEAIRYFEECEKVALSLYGDQSLERAKILVTLASVKIGANNAESCITNLMEAKPIIKEKLGEYSNEYMRLCFELSSAYYEMKQYEDAAQNFEQGYIIRKKNLQENFRFMTNAERSAYYTQDVEPFTQEAFYLAAMLPEDSKYQGIIYDNELLCKGLLLSSEAEFKNFIRKTTDSRIRNLYNEYQENGMFLKAEAQNPENERALNYNDILLRNSQIERELVTISSEVADLTPNINVSWTDVRKSLGKNDVAIEFINSDNQYSALVVTPYTKTPNAVYLFEERDFKRKLYQGSDSESDITLKPYESTVMYDIIWRKLEKYLTPGCNVYFAPKGMIHTLAIEYAPISRDSLVNNKYRMHRISSTRNLVSKQRNKDNRNAVLYGGIRYGYKHHGAQLNYLKGSFDEMDTISKCLSGININTFKYTEDQATVESFLNLSSKDISILHVATHGLFEDRKSLGLDNSGLAMSDNVLTSSQIAEMNLANTELVVLSACETAKGNVSGEGVFGLQRAFKLAGCKTIVMSLWPVNDYATRLMMTEFYNNMYVRGMNKRDAFKRAVDNLRFKKYTTPWHWAAFIMLD